MKEAWISLAYRQTPENALGYFNIMDAIQTSDTGAHASPDFSDTWLVVPCYN